MKILALDCSTPQASLALMDDRTVVATRPMDIGQRRSQDLFDAVEHLLAAAKWRLDDVDAFAVGRGPGSYTGLRVSLAAAKGWALPGGKPVWTVHSGAATAAEWLTRHPDSSQVVAWGEARRGSLWASCFERHNSLYTVRIGDIKVISIGEKARLWPDIPWVPTGQSPDAEWIGRLFSCGIPSEDLQPIYVHAAVAIPPRFGNDGQLISN